MLSVRGLNLPGDREALLALDTSFTTERVFRVSVTSDSFVMQEGTVSPPLRKVYDLSAEVDRLPVLDHVLVALLDARVAGVATLSNDSVDRRAIVRHLYVDRGYRGRGIGHALMDAMVNLARHDRARCLWLETQDVNYPAIRFYKRLGFEWCGLDLSLDERHGSPTDETAVFFMRALD